MLLTLGQAAEKAGLKRKTLGQWVWRVGAGLPLHEDGRRLVRLLRRVGRARRIDERDLEAWLAGRGNGGRPWAEADGLPGKILALADEAEAAGRPALADALRAVLALAGEAALTDRPPGGVG